MTGPTKAITEAVRERFARQLRALRIPRGFKTARSFALALGIDENRYTRYERAEVEPDLSLIQRICETLRVTPNDLLNLHDEPATRYSSGFADLADQVYAPPNTKAREPHSEPSVNASLATPDLSKSIGDDQKATRRRVLAWQLAARLASLAAGQETAPLKVTSSYFAAIEADPFGFAMRLPNDAALARADGAEQQRIAGMVDALVSAVEDLLTEAE